MTINIYDSSLIELLEDNYLEYFSEEENFGVCINNPKFKNIGVFTIYLHNYNYQFTPCSDNNIENYYRANYIYFDKKKWWISYYSSSGYYIYAESTDIPVSKYLFPKNWKMIKSHNDNNLILLDYIADYYNIRTYHQISGISRHFKHRYNKKTKSNIIKLLLIFNRFFKNKNLMIPQETKETILDSIRPIDLNIILQN